MSDHQEGLWFIDPANVVDCDVDKYTPKTSIRAIQEQVCREHGIPMSAMLSPMRAKKYTIPRHIAIYRAYKQCRWSFPQIGKAFDRDHTSIIHVVRMMERDEKWLAKKHRKKVKQTCKPRTNMVQLIVG